MAFPSYLLQLCLHGDHTLAQHTLHHRHVGVDAADGLHHAALRVLPSPVPGGLLRGDIHGVTPPGRGKGDVEMDMSVHGGLGGSVCVRVELEGRA